MTESIKFGPEWLRNSVANVVAPANQQQQQQQQQQSSQQSQQQQQLPSTDSIISRPVLSDHRYGREEMLSLCDKTARLPDALPRFRRLFVAEWQTPLALQPNTDDEQIGTRGLGGAGTPQWGTHIRPLMPAMSRGTGMIRGGAIERGRGRGRGLYHGTSYTRSTSLYDEEGRRWIDRNGTEGTTEWSTGGSAISPRKEGFSRSALESWRKGTRDENEEGWRSSSSSNNNGTTTGSGGPPAREKWTRSTSWRDGTDNSITSDPERANGTSHQQLLNSSSSPTSGVGGGNAGNSSNSSSLRAPVGYKKSWDEDSNLPEWATESFDYGGTFDASGAFHDSDRTGSHDDDRGAQQQQQQQQQPKQQQNHEETTDHNEDVLEVEQQQQQSPPQQQQSKLMMDFLNEETQAATTVTTTSSVVTTTTEKQQIDLPNGPIATVAATSPAPIAQMDKMVENFVAHLIMDDDTSVKQPPVVSHPLIEWFYRDPQGDTQGPFSSTDMSEWYKAGYFQESLMVRRSIDSTFVPLGQLVKVFGALRPFIAASIDGGQPIPQPEPSIDQFRLQRMQQQQQQPPPQQQQPPPPQQPQPQQQQQPPVTDVNNWSMMTAEQRMFLMQFAHQRQPQPVDVPYAMKQPQQQQPLDMRRMMGANDFFQSSAVPTVVPPQQQQQQQPPPTTQMEPDPLQQLIMQIQMQQKTGGPDTAQQQQQQQWIKQSQQQQQPTSVMQMQGNGPMDLNVALGGLTNQHSGVPPSVVTAAVVTGVTGAGGGGSGVNVNHQPQSSTAHWNATPLPIWDMGGSSSNNNNNNNILKDQNNQQSQQSHTMPEIHHQQQQQQQQEPDIIQNGIIDSEQHIHAQQQQMQKVESKKKKKETAKEQQQQQQQQMVKEQKKQQQQKEEKKKSNEKQQQQQKKEERSTQPAAPAPWVGLQATVSGTSLTKIQKTEAQRRQVELAAQKEREHQKLEIMAKLTEVRDVKWNLQAAHVKSLDEIQAEEQTAAEREAAIAKREKKETVTIVADIWSTGAHSMAWQQPKAWNSNSAGGSGAGGGQSNSGFWEDPVKPQQQPKQPQLLSKSQTMATITTAKKQQQQQQQIQQQQQQQQKKIERKVVKNDNKKKDEINNEFTQWCTRTLSAMNGNVDVPTFVSFLQDIESPFEIKDYIKMYLGETKECTEFAKQFLERRSKQRNQQRLQNAHIDDMCSPAPAINPQANNSGDFQEVKGKNKKVKAKKVMKAVDNRILGFTATSAPDRINVGDRDYGDA